MKDAVPGGHPDQDVLADLLAEALPAPTAREIESHVMSCPDCERLLADAERVRYLLATPSPEPGAMPDDVWSRIEAGLAAEAGQQTRAISTQGWFDITAGAAPPAAPPAPAPPAATPLPTAPHPTAAPLPPAAFLPTAPIPTPTPTSRPAVPPVVSPTGSVSIAPTLPPSLPPAAPPPPRNLTAPDPVPVPPPPALMSFDEAPTAAWKAFLSEPPEPPPAEPVQQRVGRAVRSIRSRRDVRTEDRGGRPWQRPGVLVAAAAAGVAVLGLGGVATMSLLGDDHTGAATDALPGAGTRSIVHASGTEYTALTLAQQVKSLVTTGSPGPAGTPAKTSPTASAKAAASPSVSATSPAAIKPGTVADPTRLAQCLTGLGDGDREAVAVDLARWKGREAAVIVLAGRSGGFDVWVVARDCHPGAEGTLAYKQLPG